MSDYYDISQEDFNELMRSIDNISDQLKTIGTMLATAKTKYPMPQSATTDHLAVTQVASTQLAPVADKYSRLLSELADCGIDISKPEVITACKKEAEYE